MIASFGGVFSGGLFDELEPVAVDVGEDGGLGAPGLRCRGAMELDTSCLPALVDLVNVGAEQADAGPHSGGGSLDQPDRARTAGWQDADPAETVDGAVVDEGEAERSGVKAPSPVMIEYRHRDIGEVQPRRAGASCGFGAAQLDVAESGDPLSGLGQSRFLAPVDHLAAV